MFDLPHLTVRYHPHTDRDDHEHIKSSAAHDSARTQITGQETVTAHLKQSHTCTDTQ